MNRHELLHHIALSSGVLDNEGVLKFVAAHDAPTPVSIRLHPSKWTGKPSLAPVPWASNAFYTNGRPSFTFDPLFHAGVYYVQEASSMFLERAVKACGFEGKDILALDLCAAPGGKSTHLLSILGKDAVLVSNEVIRPRAKVLCDNITKWGMPNVCVTGSDTALFLGLPDYFDLVVVDAPCSGEGLFRKDLDAMQHWSEEAVSHCAARQANILEHAWATLRPGGCLVYSTCTYNRLENEENMQRLIELGGTSISIPIDSSWGVTEVCGENFCAYRFMPHLTLGEGFFISVVRKPESGQTFRPSHGKLSLKVSTNAETQGWISPIELQHLDVVAHNDKLLAMTQRMSALLPGIIQHVYPLQIGVEVATVKNGVNTPSHALAASVIVNVDAFPIIDTSLQEAVQYLRGNPVAGTGAKGWGIVSYNGQNLGFAKGAGNRWNNHYPTPLRIRDMRTDVMTTPLVDLT